MAGLEFLPPTQRPVEISASLVPKGLRFERTVSCEGSLRYDWNLIGPAGAISVWGWPLITGFTPDQWLGGIECHYAKCPHEPYQEPSNEVCHVLNAPCWHDGSSLQFTQRIAPLLPYPDNPEEELEFSASIQNLILMVAMEYYQRYFRWECENSEDI